MKMTGEAWVDTGRIGLKIGTMVIAALAHCATLLDSLQPHSYLYRLVQPYFCKEEVMVMIKYFTGLVLAAVLLFQGCTWDLMGPCHRATLLRRDAEHATGFKKAELLGKADALQVECDKQMQQIEKSQRPGR
jgi:hypothetical protein